MTKKILFISLGSIGRRHLRNTRSLLPDAEIAVYRQHTQSDTNIPEGADKMFSSLQEAKDFQPNIVIISSPASEHIRNANEFLENSDSLFIEKPLSDRYNELGSFVKKCNDSAAFVMIGYVLRFLPVLNSIKAYLASNALGKIYTAHVQVGQYLPDWRPDSNYREGVSAQKILGGGVLLELSHELDYACWLFGIPDSLLCSAGHISDLEIDVEDSANIIFEYNNPARKVMIQLDFLQRVAEMRLQIIGEKGTIVADLIKEKALLYSPEYEEGFDLKFDASKNGNEVYLRQFDLLFHKTFKDYTPKFSETKHFSQWSSSQDAARVMQLIDAARKSNNEGVRVEIVND